jgi:ATP-binding protein involved in chromosome partitioning
MNRSSPSLDSVHSALCGIHNSDSGVELVTSQSLRCLDIAGKNISLELELGYPANSRHEEFRHRIHSALQEIPGFHEADITIKNSIAAHQACPSSRPVPGVKNVIASTAGKAGVGKSTTVVNLALALTVEGARVGLLEADIFEPSIPTMLGISRQHPVSEDGERMEPLVAHGIEVMSIGFLVESDAPMIWRGPMAVHALNQLLFETHWHDLDYLLIDLPPGAGDIPMSVIKKAPVSGALVITTPHEVALADGRKSLQMLEKMDVPILGVVENMSTHVCPNCGHAEHIYGVGGGEKLGNSFGVECLGWLPLEISIRKMADEGYPVMLGAPASRTADIYRSIARRMGARLVMRLKEWQAKPSPVSGIEVEKMDCEEIDLPRPYSEYEERRV